MTGYDFTLAGAKLTALSAGALWWGDEGLLCVSDLHLGKSERILRHGGSALPPYETRDTLGRLADLLEQFQPQQLICLGDSFDDLVAAEALVEQDADRLSDLVQALNWIWIEGNHDPGATRFGGQNRRELRLGPLLFRHIAKPECSKGEISGHYHPKVKLRRGPARTAFLLDETRAILPAFGTYTGGLRSDDPALGQLMGPQAIAVLTGATALPCPMPR